jgi:hypothetical protein
VTVRPVDVREARASVRAATTRTRTAAVGQPTDVRAQLQEAAELLGRAEEALTRALYHARRLGLGEEAPS